MPYRRATYASLDRMLYLHERLAAGHPVNCTTAARAMEVAPLTIWRDAAYMRDRLNLPLAFDSSANTYRYTEPVKAFPTVKVSEGEVFSLLIASKALEQYRGTSFHAQLHSSFAKLSANLRDEVSFSPAEELQGVSFKALGRGKSDTAIFEVLNRGLLRRRQVEFDYRRPGQSAVSRRCVQPYHLSQRGNLWYMVAYDLKRKALRTFAVPRIRAAVLTDVTFTRPRDFSAEDYFAGALGAQGGPGNHRVRVRFRGAAADLVREREWHDSQVLRDVADGRVELELTLGALEEVRNWIMTWGPDAEVVAPKELREDIKRRLAEMTGIYAG